jgi:ribosomal protein S4
MLKKILNRYQICRKLNSDIWGNVLFSQKNINRLFFSFYRLPEDTTPVFVLRIDKLKPKKINRYLSPFIRNKIEKKKAMAFYDLSLNKIKVLCQFYKYGDGKNPYLTFIDALESQLHVILWRLDFFKTTREIKNFLYSKKIFINKRKTAISPGYRLRPYDFVTFHKEPDLRLFKSKFKNNTFRLRNFHIWFDFTTFSFIYLNSPNPNKLFFFFQLDLTYVYSLIRTT